MSTFSRLHRATAIVPLAVLSAAWTASLAGVGVTAGQMGRPMGRLGREKPIPVKEGGECPALGLGGRGFAVVPGELFRGAQRQRFRVGGVFPPGPLQVVPRKRQRSGARLAALAAQNLRQQK